MKNTREVFKFSRDRLEILEGWLYAHRYNPYPTEAEKLELAWRTSLKLAQINCWFCNARRRILPKMVRIEGYIREEKRRKKSAKYVSTILAQYDKFQILVDVAVACLNNTYLLE